MFILESKLQLYGVAQQSRKGAQSHLSCDLELVSVFPDLNPPPYSLSHWHFIHPYFIYLYYTYVYTYIYMYIVPIHYTVYVCSMYTHMLGFRKQNKPGPVEELETHLFAHSFTLLLLSSSLDLKHAPRN